MKNWNIIHISRETCYIFVTNEFIFRLKYSQCSENWSDLYLILNISIQTLTIDTTRSGVKQQR